MFNRRYWLIGTWESKTIFTVPAWKIYIVGQCVPGGTAVSFKLNWTIIHGSGNTSDIKNIKWAVFVEWDVLTWEWVTEWVMVSREEIDV